MSLFRAYPQGWSTGEKYTAAQANTMDANGAAAIDKRAQYGDIFGSMLVATGAGRIISTVATGPDSNITFHPTGPNSIVRIPTLTDARAYTLGHSGATGGDRMLFYIEGTGASPSGYVDIKNNVGTGLARLGMVNHSSPNLSAETASAEFIFSGTGIGWQLLCGVGPGLRVIEFTSSTTWIAPPGVHSALAYGYGAGGGGGAGQDAAGSVSRAPGGGGGGGAIASTQRISVSPLRSYSINIGAGGTGISVGLGGNGGDGGDTTIAYAGVAIATWKGAGGGGVCTNSTATTIHHFAKGGGSVAWPIAYVGGSGADQSVRNLRVPSGLAQFGWFGPGWGGNGCNKGVPTAMMMSHGLPSLEGYAGGVPGLVGTSADGAALFGGGAGGGGGAGPGGAGATGGYGGPCIDAGASNSAQRGGTGMAAPANSGAGGGGGGGGGGVGGDSGGNGGAGGSGKLTIMFIK